MPDEPGVPCMHNTDQGPARRVQTASGAAAATCSSLTCSTLFWQVCGGRRPSCASIDVHVPECVYICLLEQQYMGCTPELLRGVLSVYLLSHRVVRLEICCLCAFEGFPTFLTSPPPPLPPRLFVTVLCLWQSCSSFLLSAGVGRNRESTKADSLFATKTKVK